MSRGPQALHQLISAVMLNPQPRHCVCGVVTVCAVSSLCPVHFVSPTCGFCVQIVSKITGVLSFFSVVGRFLVIVSFLCLSLLQIVCICLTKFLNSQHSENCE